MPDTKRTMEDLYSDLIACQASIVEAATRYTDASPDDDNAVCTASGDIIERVKRLRQINAEIDAAS